MHIHFYTTREAIERWMNDLTYSAQYRRPSIKAWEKDSPLRPLDATCHIHVSVNDVEWLNYGEVLIHESN